MKKIIIMLAVAFTAAITGVRAQTDTSYLLIQGPFGAGGAEETFDWQVNYQAGTLVSGQDLLTAVLGSTSPDGTYSDNFGGTYNYYISGNGTQGAGYIDDETPPAGTLAEPFMISVTLNSTTVAQDASYANIWNYYVADGSGALGPNDDGDGSSYSDGTWTYSNDGSISRTLSNGSFDAWVFGSSYPTATVADGTPLGGTNDDGSTSSGVNVPTAANFANATVITVVPEPGSTALVLCSAAGMFALLKRRRA